MSLYLDIFTESVLVSSIIPLVSNPTFYAAKAFSANSDLYSFNMTLAVALAVCGSFFGALFNLSIGEWFLKHYRKEKNLKYMPAKTYAKASIWFNKFGFVVLFFSWFPLLNFSVLAAGFFGMRSRIVLPLVVAGQALHYGWFLF